MSDRTSMSAIVYFDREPTAEERRRFTAISDSYDGEDWNLGDPERHSLGFGLQENVCGGSEEIFEQLCEGLPDAAEIVVWEDPKYEWLGQLFRWKQGQDKPFSAQCDANGLIVLTEGDIERSCMPSRRARLPARPSSCKSCGRSSWRRSVRLRPDRQDGGCGIRVRNSLPPSDWKHE
jgi:hypothetical protein